MGLLFAMFGRSRSRSGGPQVRAAVALLSATSFAIAGLAVSAGPAAGATVGSDRAQIDKLEQQIAARGTYVQSLVSRYNEVQARVDALDAQIAEHRKQFAADQRAEEAASRALRRVAVDAYVTGGSVSPALSLFSDTTNVSTSFERNHYLGAVNSKLNDVMNTLELDKERTQRAGNALRTAQSRAESTLHQLASARDAAQSAIASDAAMLRRVNGNLRSLLAAANARREAAQRAAERALAAAQRAPQEQPSAPGSSPSAAPTPSQVPAPPPVPVPPPTPGVYANPLRGITALTAERVDQGVDYSGFGPIYAIGNGVVLSTVNSGWPGGTFIAYRLTDGPANGLVVFAAEDISPSVAVGSTVTSNTVLGQMYAGPDGIEMGWAEPSGTGDTMARRYGQYGGSNSTAFGYNFSQLLQSLGAPGGILSNDPPTGSLPDSWPHW